jgi:hypothetical protein
MAMSEDNVIGLEPDKLGRILIEIDMDADKYHIAMTNMETAKLMKPIEMNNLFSPFHAACIINELKRRKESQLITKATPKMIVEINDRRKTQ